MEALRQYAFSVIGGAMVCGVVLGFSPKGPSHEILKLLCGLFLTVSILYPMANRNWRIIPEDLTSHTMDEAQQAASMGENYSRDVLAQCIKAETEEYILDKAAAMEASLTVQVTVAGEEIPVPVAVVLSGEVNAAAQKRLEQIISEDLGISKENQLWTEGNFAKK